MNALDPITLTLLSVWFLMIAIGVVVALLLVADTLIDKACRVVEFIRGYAGMRAICRRGRP